MDLSTDPSNGNGFTSFPPPSNNVFPMELQIDNLANALPNKIASDPPIYSPYQEACLFSIAQGAGNTTHND
jgi:hypothetical protein